MNSIVEVLSSWANNRDIADKTAWTFLDDRGKIVDSYTYSELERVTDILGAHLLTNCQLKPGDRALLVFVPGLDFMVSLLACFKAGIIAVPVFPPDPFKLKKDMHHFVSIQQSSGADTALTHGVYNSAKKYAKLSSMFSSSTGVKWPDHLRWVVLDDILTRAKKNQRVDASIIKTLPPKAKADDQIAFLQYTSGSTSEPKGVMISHANLAHNQCLIATELRTTTDTICVSWLPQYHDMGLIGSYLGTIQCGGSGYYISSISYLKDPLLWVNLLSRFKGTHTQAPSFAYALTARKFKEYKKRGNVIDLDLSATQHMINAAEPVDPLAITSFYDIFSPYGLPKNVIVPTYGLAEHTVFVCSGGKQVERFDKKALEAHEAVLSSSDSDSASSRLLVGCGYPGNADGVDLRIVDPDSCIQLSDGKVGEIWIHSLSKAGGYWAREDVSAEAFRVSLKESSDNEGKVKTFLRTGDLGFYHKGELFICGRIKDLLIVRGSNHYPQDIERTAEQCEGGKNILRAGRSAVFSIPASEGKQERIILIAEAQQGIKGPALANAISSCRNAISDDHGIALAHICLLAIRSIPKTTSGKIARAWCRREFEAGTLNVLAEQAFSNDTTENSNGNDGASKISTGESVPLSSEGMQIVGTNDNGDALDEYNGPSIPHFESPHTVREVALIDLETYLESALLEISMSGGIPLESPIVRNVPVSKLGLDSLLLIQLTGVVQKRFFCDIPDIFLMTDFATIQGLAATIKRGGLTDEQQNALADIDDGTVEVVNMKQPLCPWQKTCGCCG
jgi:acyl-CoA synthetase (AMP-forming)/AMP-acid ligase II